MPTSVKPRPKPRQPDRAAKLARSAPKIARVKNGVRNALAMTVESALEAVTVAGAEVAIAIRAEPVRVLLRVRAPCLARAQCRAKFVKFVNRVKSARFAKFVRSVNRGLSVRSARSARRVKKPVGAPASEVNAPTAAANAARVAVRLVAWKNLRSVPSEPRSPRLSLLLSPSEELLLSRHPSRPIGTGWMTLNAVSGCARTVKLRLLPPVRRVASAADVKIVVATMAIAEVGVVVGTKTIQPWRSFWSSAPINGAWCTPSVACCSAMVATSLVIKSS